MGKKQKLSAAPVVEESREPASYSLSEGAGAKKASSKSSKKEKRAHAAADGDRSEPPAAAVAAAVPAEPAAAPAAEEEGYGDDGGGGYDAAYGNEGYNQAAGGGGGGSRVDPETLAYLTEVCEHLSHVAHEPEEAALLIANVLEELAGRELRIATDAASSKLLEQLLVGAPASQLMQFLAAFKEEEAMWRLAGGAFGSHVAEKVLAWLHQAAMAAEAEAAAGAQHDNGDEQHEQEEEQAAAAAPAETLDALRQLLDELLDAVEPHLVDYATDKHATHVARALLVVLTGRDVLTPAGKKQAQRAKLVQQQGGGEDGGDGQQQQPYLQFSFGGKQPRSSLAEKLVSSKPTQQQQQQAAARFPGLLKRFVRALPCHDPPSIAALGKNSAGGPLLQATLRAAAHDTELLMLLLPPIIGLEPSKAAAAAPGSRLTTLTDSSVGRLLRDDCYSHLLEVAVAVMPQSHGSAGSTGASLADEFFDRFLKGRLLPLAHHHCANFVVQAAIAAAASTSRVSAFITELGPHMPDLLRRRRSGVVAALAAAAARAGPGLHQDSFIAALATALGALPQWAGRTGTAHLAPALMTLDTSVNLGSSNGSSGGRLSTPGCALLATLLGGQFPAKTVAPFLHSMMELGASGVLRVAKDPAGSRVLQAVLVVPAAAGEQAAPSASKRRKQKKKQQREAAGGGGDADDTTAGAADGSGDDLAAAARGVLMSQLAGHWGSIALLPAGSFLLEAVYNSLDAEQQETLVAEVARSHDSLISRCSWGALLARKLGLEAYLRSPEEWRKRAASAAAARRSFESLLAQQPQQKKGKEAAAGEGSKASKKRHTADEEEQQQQDNNNAAAAAAETQGERKKKRKRHGASPAAAAEAILSTEKPSKKQKKQRQQQQEGGGADVHMADASPPAGAGAAAAADGDTEMRSASKTGSGSKKAKSSKEGKRKRSTSKGLEAAADAPGGGSGVNVMALLGFGGLSPHQQHDKQGGRKRSKKHKRH